MAPELNRIEEVWRQIKYQDLPVRGYRTLADPRAAVERALSDDAPILRDATTVLDEAA